MWWRPFRLFKTTLFYQRFNFIMFLLIFCVLCLLSSFIPLILFHTWFKQCMRLSFYISHIFYAFHVCNSFTLFLLFSDFSIVKISFCLWLVLFWCFANQIKAFRTNKHWFHILESSESIQIAFRYLLQKCVLRDPLHKLTRILD